VGEDLPVVCKEPVTALAAASVCVYVVVAAPVVALVVVVPFPAFVPIAVLTIVVVPAVAVVAVVRLPPPSSLASSPPRSDDSAVVALASYPGDATSLAFPHIRARVTGVSTLVSVFVSISYQFSP
jgi:hypothetical protein